MLASMWVKQVFSASQELRRTVLPSPPSLLPPSGLPPRLATPPWVTLLPPLLARPPLACPPWLGAEGEPLFPEATG